MKQNWIPLVLICGCATVTPAQVIHQWLGTGQHDLRVVDGGPAALDRIELFTLGEEWVEIVTGDFNGEIADEISRLAIGNGRSKITHRWTGTQGQAFRIVSGDPDEPQIRKNGWQTILGGEHLGEFAEEITALVQMGHERPPQHPRPTGPPQEARAAKTAAGGFYQISVDAAGMDRPDDANNEPSCALLPSGRIVCAYRHFASYLSDWRQPCWSWSDDGGQSLAGIAREAWVAP